MAGENKMQPLIGEEFQPGSQTGTISDFEKSPATAYEQMSGTRSASANKRSLRKELGSENEPPRETRSIDEEKQKAVAANLATRKAEATQNKKESGSTDQIMKQAATAATKIPGVGWYIKVIAIIIRILKIFTGEQIAGFLAIWFLVGTALAFLNILPIVGTILFLIIPPCAALPLTALLWPKIKPFLEEAGKITPIKK